VSWLRCAIRVVLVVATSLAAFAILLPSRLLLGPRTRRANRVRRWCMRNWARIGVKIIGARVELEGTVPPAPCVLVSNHLGYLDILVLGSCVDTRFVSKHEVRSWPLIGWCAHAVGTIFLDRASRRDLPSVNAEIHSALEAGDRVLFFPEGTSTGGIGMLPFKSSLLEPAAASGYPVFCAAVHYATPPGEPAASQVVCWWGEMPFHGHVLRLLRLSRIRARVVFHPEPHVGEGRKELAARTEKVVHAMLQRLNGS
jgi:1-acyl-sn-glycerol-3-phosphate acyltransferase